jgi:hypothetical protein
VGVDGWIIFFLTNNKLDSIGRSKAFQKRMITFVQHLKSFFFFCRLVWLCIIIFIYPKKEKTEQQQQKTF